MSPRRVVESAVRSETRDAYDSGSVQSSANGETRLQLSGTGDTNVVVGAHTDL